MPSLERPEWDDVRDAPGWRARRARVGAQAGAERVGVSLWEVEPGQAAYPYHAHHAEEEVVVVLDGRPSLRTPAGWHELEPGEVVCFARGEAGAHQIVNRTGSSVRFLAISTAGEPEITLQLDSGKLGARVPGAASSRWFRLADEVGYLEGELPPDR